MILYVYDCCFQLLSFVHLAIYFGIARIYQVMKLPMLDAWRAHLAKPPPAAVDSRKRLVARAASLVTEGTPSSAQLPPDLDVVVAGSGFMSLYFLGVHSVLAALERAGQTRIHRYAGASSGAQTPFELSLIGEDATLDTYLSHGSALDAMNTRTHTFRLP